jgi:hypothetical protein
MSLCSMYGMDGSRHVAHYGLSTVS